MLTSLAFFNLGPMDIAVVAMLGILLFGRRLPEIGRNVGKSITEFKKGLNNTQDDINTSLHDDVPPPDRTPPRRVSNAPTATRQIKQIASGGDEP
jgi:sec-independent protein translocase protein TatA